MEEELSLKEMQKEWHGSYHSYVIGLIASLLLTSFSFLSVIYQVLPPHHLMLLITGLALTQATIQLIYFLHLGQEPSPKWETLIFFFMFFILLVIAIGTLWIMTDLEERTMNFHTEAMHD